MEKEQFLKLLAQCLKDGDIEIRAYYDRSYPYSEENTYIITTVSILGDTVNNIWEYAEFK